MKYKHWIPYLFAMNGIILSAFLIITLAGNRAITVIGEKMPLNNRKCIIIDAGHGGVDTGATSCAGFMESEINLEIATRLNDLFHLLGYDTLMIRTTDISIHTEGESIAAKKVSDLKERVRIVNNTENAILVSIHQNYFTDGRYSGAQVFYSNSEYSRKLAQKLQSSFVTTINPGSKRQAKPANGVYLLNNIKQPGVLIECGFLSNINEEAKLRNDTYQKALCCIVASVISGFTGSDSVS